MRLADIFCAALSQIDSCLLHVSCLFHLSKYLNKFVKLVTRESARFENNDSEPKGLSSS